MISDGSPKFVRVNVIVKGYFVVGPLFLHITQQVRTSPLDGCLALIPKEKTDKQICTVLAEENIILTPRDGYVRFAPHVCSTEEEVLQAVEALNRI